MEQEEKEEEEEEEEEKQLKANESDRRVQGRAVSLE